MAGTLLWWEKTVEYAFVLAASDAGIAFHAPLDGNHERAGDNIFLTMDKYLLIEFKRSRAEIGSEKKKFDQLDAATKQNLSVLASDAHFFVYGEESADAGTTRACLDLVAHAYFGNALAEPALQILQRGKARTKFEAYLTAFTEAKKGGGEGGGGLTLDDFSMVVGIAQTGAGQRAAMLTLSEFRKLRPDAVPSARNDQSGGERPGYKPPRMS